MTATSRALRAVAARAPRAAMQPPPRREAMNSRRLMSSMALPYPPSVRPSRSLALGGNVDPQKHDQENHDRIEHDPDDVGSRMPSLRYNLLVHGGSPQGRKPHAWIAAQSTCRRAVGKSLGQT